MSTRSSETKVAHGIQSIRIDRRAACFEGASFRRSRHVRAAGWKCRGQLDPRDPRNQGIVNLDLAPRNAQGLVEYTVDLCILKPVDLSRGNGWLFYEVLNRGSKRALCRVNTAPAVNLPDTAADAGNGFLMKEGFTLVWTGWQSDVTRDNGRMIADFPVPTNHGQPIVDQSLEEFIDLSDGETFIGKLTYPAADLSPDKATLTVRERERDPRQQPAGLSWRYIDDLTVEITRPRSSDFDKGAIYEFIYPAKDPKVTGIAFASVRDIVSFLRHETHAADGSVNPFLVDGSPAMKRAMNVRTFAKRPVRPRLSLSRIQRGSPASERCSMRRCPSSPDRGGRWSTIPSRNLDVTRASTRTTAIRTTSFRSRIASCAIRSAARPQVSWIAAWQRDVPEDHAFRYGRGDLVCPCLAGGHRLRRQRYRATGECAASISSRELSTAIRKSFPTASSSTRTIRCSTVPCSGRYLRAMVDWVDDDIRRRRAAFHRESAGTLVPVSELNFDRVPGLEVRRTHQRAAADGLFGPAAAGGRKDLSDLRCAGR